jgi:putative transposase
LPSETIEQNFLHRVERRVSSDSTIQLQKHLFEVHHRLIGQRIKIRYLPTDLAIAYLYNDDGQCEGQLHLVRKIDNAKIKRKNHIDYTQMEGVNQHV